MIGTGGAGPGGTSAGGGNLGGEETLAALVQRLTDAAERLRAEELDPDEAANLVEECARLAAQAGAELDRRLP